MYDKINENDLGESIYDRVGDDPLYIYEDE